jgi:acyl-CoA synthetase (AMP-forming)/AMP-acid ligase II
MHLCQNKRRLRVFEEKAKNTPNAIAVVYKDKEVTYKELNEEANKLANYLIQQGGIII